MKEALSIETERTDDIPLLDGPQQQSILRDLHDYEASLSYQEVRGAISLLRELKRLHIPVALVTGAGQWKVEIVIQQLGLEALFTTRVTSDDVQASKPAPDSYLLAAHRLGKGPQACIVFEDAVNGVQAALAARAVCIGVLTTASTRSLVAAGATCTISDFTTVRVQAAPATAQPTDTRFFLEVEKDCVFPFRSSS